MNRSTLQRSRFLLAAIVLSSVVVLSESSFGLCDVEISEDTESESFHEQYRALLQNFKRFKVLLRQQPENTALLQEELAKLDRETVRLRKFIGGVDEGDPVREALDTRYDVEAGRVENPPEPVRPSHEPPSNEDIERYMEAIEKTHLPARPLKQPSSTRDASVATDFPQWVWMLSDASRREIEKISGMLEQPHGDSIEIDTRLSHLERLLYALATPPPAVVSSPEDDE